MERNCGWTGGGQASDIKRMVDWTAKELILFCQKFAFSSSDDGLKASLGKSL